MKQRNLNLLIILLICLFVPSMALGETFNDKLHLPDFSLADYPATTSKASVEISFSGSDGYTYVLEHQYKGVWLAAKSVQLSGSTGTFTVECLPGANKFVLRNHGQSRSAKSSIIFTIACTASDIPATVQLPTPTLRKGSKGAAVKALHQVLTDLGVYDGALSTTFTEATRKAVIAAQALFAIQEDGVAGPKTLHLLDLTTYTVASSSIGGSSSGGQDIGSSYLKKGSKGQDVRKLQKRLLDLGYAPGTADGIFGDMTLEAVLLYQKNAKITQDGIVGPVTWAKLNSGAASLVPKPPQSRYLKKGDKGDDVVKVQARLIVLGYLDDIADGIFGKLTYAAVIDYQKDENIKVDGIVGPVTYGRLFP